MQTSNFQAEYGRSAGATITVVTKSGARSSAGRSRTTKRDEKLNANTWDRRRSCDAPIIVSAGLPIPAARRRSTATRNRAAPSAVRC